ncbi:MAG: hypothetical protein ABSG95_08560 [Solirubrobacteraceae bacterium]
MELDRQAIEKRDFPIGRRGYDPAAVDAHLRALATEIEELQRAASGPGTEPSLAFTASTQVQSILAAAETAAADIERQALQSASNLREEASRDAARTREDAVKQAQGYVAAVAQATSVLLERVASMDSEVNALLESLRAGATRLATDLAAVEANMGELYDAAAGRAQSAEQRQPAPSQDDAGAGRASASVGPAFPADRSASAPAPESAPAPVSALTEVPGSTLAPAPSAPAVSARSPRPDAAAAPASETTPAGAENGDVDGARLIALNMALNGESRADAERYLAENFKLTDRQKLIDEVYAAIEG